MSRADRDQFCRRSAQCISASSPAQYRDAHVDPDDEHAFQQAGYVFGLVGSGGAAKITLR